MIRRPGGGGRNAQADWKGQPRSNDTHASTTDPDARNYRKSHNTASILCYQGHALMENRNGLVVSAVVSHADGCRRTQRGIGDARCDADHDRSPQRRRRQSLRHRRLRRRVPRAQGHAPRRRQRHASRRQRDRRAYHPPPGYRLSQIIRKRIEEHFGWGKTIGRIRQTVFRGLQRVDQHFKLTMTASNLMRLARIPVAVPSGAAP